jgi:AGCS family alanine or glycine:cation symporter
VGNLVQVNAFMSPFSHCHIALKIKGILSFAIPIVIIHSGGLKRFANFMSCCIPLMGIIYIVICIVGISLLHHRLGFVLWEIFRNAINPHAAGGGSAGALFLAMLQSGISRGLFATDIGLGLAAIAHGNVQGRRINRWIHAQQQGKIALVAPILVATLCFMTGVLILCAAPDFPQTASQICIDTFVHTFHTPYAGWFIPVIIYCFALTTILAWAWFAEHVFLFYNRIHWLRYYHFLSIAAIPAGALIHSALPWHIADICVCGLLLCNLYAIFSLRKVVEKIQNYKN